MQELSNNPQSTKTWVELVREFAEKYRLDEPQTFNGLDAVGGFRSAFLQEEVCEIREAFRDHNPEQVLDGLVDLVYVAIGTALLYGWDIEEAFKRVHEANMRKERVSKEDQSKRGTTLDVIKPPGWQPPILKDLV